MARFESPLNDLKVASPCAQDWNAMIGDARRRYCGECKLNVYNLSGLTRAEAEELLLRSEGRLCVRFYRRADGSVLTADCPVGWARVVKRAKIVATAAASLVFSFFGALGAVTAFSRPDPVVMGGIAPIASTPTPQATPESRLMMGTVTVRSDEPFEEVIGRKMPPQEKVRNFKK